MISLIKLFNESLLSYDHLSTGFIDPKGEFHAVGDHHTFAQRYFEKQYNEYYKPLEAIYKLLRLGWIRVNNNAFEICKINRDIKDYIFLYSKEHRLDKIFIDYTDESDKTRPIFYDDQSIEDVLDL
jgi:hypothetical protein